MESLNNLASGDEDVKIKLWAKARKWVFHQSKQFVSVADGSGSALTELVCVLQTLETKSVFKRSVLENVYKAALSHEK